MIKQLTKNQGNQLSSYHDDWTNVVLSTQPADHIRAEAAIGKIYHDAGLPTPAKIIWFGGPVAMINASYVGRPTVYSQIRTSAWVETFANIQDVTSSEVRRIVSESLGYYQWDNICDPIKNEVWNSVSSAAFTSVLYGSQEVRWLAKNEFYQKTLRLINETSKLNGFFELARSAGWAIPYADVCLVSERPKTLKYDRLGCLHSEDGPAVVYPDGWSIFAEDGVITGTMYV
jgi:hypothetical protein